MGGMHFCLLLLPLNFNTNRALTTSQNITENGVYIMDPIRHATDPGGANAFNQLQVVASSGVTTFNAWVGVCDILRVDTFGE